MQSVYFLNILGGKKREKKRNRRAIGSKNTG